MSFSPLSYHHIGGRGGKFPIEIPAPLRKSVALTLYDADKSCISETQEKLANEGFYSIKVLPYCISDKENIEDFIITKQPHASSLLDSNPDVYDYIRNSPKFGAMRLREILSPHRREKIQTTLFTSIFQDKSLLAPDFISLDIQGKEYDVIDSSKKIFEETFLINLEVSFLPMYKNQKNFPEVHNLMTNLGFILVDLKLYDPHHVCRTPIDFDGDGFLMDGEAFYIKQPNLAKWSLGQIFKFAFAAILCRQSHLCIKIFEFINEKFSREVGSLGNEHGYVNLTLELYNAYNKSYKRYLSFFHELSVYQLYHDQAKSPMMPNQNPDLKEEELLNNTYTEILKKYELEHFLKKIENQKNINLKTLEVLKDMY